MLPSLPVGFASKVASTLKITDHKTGAQTPWEPNAEQRVMGDAMAQHRFVYIVKPRQIGASTFVCLDDVLWTWLCDDQKNPVKTAIVVDTDDKATERIRTCANFCEQLGIKVEHTQGRVKFKNGSEIVALTAGGKRVAASMTFQRYHLTELPFWEHDEDTYASLMPALSMDGRCIIETTMDIRRPLAKRLWREQNDYHKVFFSVEQHDEYRADPSGLTDSERERLRGEGFTRDDAMAWFLWAVKNRAGGDEVRAFREYPQIEEHMFQSAAGRWIARTPKVVKPLRTIRTSGTGETYLTEVFREPADCSYQLLIGVDTATGKGQDSSAVAVIDKRDGALCASFDSDTVTIDDLAMVVADVQRAFTQTERVPWSIKPNTHVPMALVEGNGIGAATFQACIRHGVHTREITTTEASRYQGLLEVKRLTESGALYGPRRLADEADDLHRDDLGRFAGKKDLCMAAGFALVDARKAPYIEPQRKEDRSQFHFLSKLGRKSAWADGKM